MNTMLNPTHDPAARSWLASANQRGGDFPIQNLPFAVFRVRDSAEPFRGGVAIGDQVIDLARLSQAGCLKGLALDAAKAGAQTTLNALMAMGPAAWSALRHGLFGLLQADAGASVQQAVQASLVPQSQVEYTVPAHIGDYTDFYTSVHHATNIGKQFRPDNPLLPNYKWVPIGYHGRASTLIPSGTPFKRPLGQLKAPDAEAPRLAPTQRLDLELELGIVIGQPSTMGQPVPMAQAEDHVFGICLLNDWSARDIQGWEYQPLGPFLSKNFASTISPWIVTLEALAPFRQPFVRDAADPQPLPYLSSEANCRAGVINVDLEVLLQTERMRQAGQAPEVISRSNFAEAAYWTVAQLVAHHTVGGCSLSAGDLFGSGTLSGPRTEQAGSLLELTAGGKQPITLTNGEQRTFLQDGDTLVLRGACQRAGYRRIGFGACAGTVLPAQG